MLGVHPALGRPDRSHGRTNSHLGKVVAREKAAVASYRDVIGFLASWREQSQPQLVEITRNEGGMVFPRGGRRPMWSC